MSHEPFRSTEAPDPFVPPSAASGFGRSVVVEPSVPPAGSSWAVRHDLTDRDLRRFPDGDFFYEPQPILGFIPLWVVPAVISVGIGVGIGWAVADSITWTGSSIGAAMGLVFLVGSGILTSFLFRRAARSGGFTEGRRVTIAEGGVWVDYPDPPGLNRDAQLDRQRRRRATAKSFPMLEGAGLTEAHYPWAEFRRVEFRYDYLILWRRGRRRLVIPVRVFESVEAAEAFARAAAGWIAERGAGGAAG